jgi:succinate dehydrogenase / fumarate reductase cytochrome b subunit
MSTVTGIFKSSLGRKYIMAGTGILLFMFVVGHLVGNLQVLGKPELINTYGHFLKSKPLLLWVVRLGLLATVVAHIVTAIQLSIENRGARPTEYAIKPTYGSTWQSRYMLLSGLVVLAFIVYHLAHFTVLLKMVNGVGDFSQLQFTLPGGIVTHDVYGMMILGFQVWWVVLFYLIAMGLLFAHLNHGLASMFQSLGLRNHVWWPRVQLFAKVASIAIFIGYAIIPISIYLRIVGGEYGNQVRQQMIEKSEAAGALKEEKK